MSGENRHWTPVPQWKDEQPHRCGVCGDTFSGRELGYMPTFCEREDCPPLPERPDPVTVVPVSALDEAKAEGASWRRVAERLEREKVEALAEARTERIFNAELQRRTRMRDERTITRGDRLIGLLGPKSSSFTFAWMATHRDRLRTLVLGGHRLSVLVVWDRKGRTRIDHDDDEVAAIRRLVYGAKEDTDAG